MKVLVTGANGMVARAAITHCEVIGDEVIGLPREALDIADKSAVTDAIRRIRPDAVLNCAAYTDVDGAESDGDRCFEVNAFGVESLAKSCGEIGAGFVTISTDYVFDGAKDGSYSEEDVPRPKNVYARAKLKGETLASEANPDSVIIRSGWIFGPGGSNFLSVIPRLLETGQRVKAIRDCYGTPTCAADLAVRLRDFAESGVTGVFHVANSGSGASYFDFATRVCELAGYDPQLVVPVNGADIVRAAPRPLNSKLTSIRGPKEGFPPLRDWEEALAEYLSVEQSEKAAGHDPGRPG
jgi:dTDP-4-dehydrorhamnose reductase